MKKDRPLEDLPFLVHVDKSKAIGYTVRLSNNDENREYAARIAYISPRI